MAKLRYVSLFSGIEAVSCALDPDVWEPVAFSEIDPFPCAVLQHHYPNVPNLGDITKIDWTPYVDTIDVVWGGSPCQSFSLAGDRSGLKGASGLMFEFIRAVRELRPRWFVWENVPGALSSENGNAFRQLLQSMDEGGYGLAWRVLDAQFFGVAQRRERVFLVGSLGTMRCAEVLFEREGMPWNPAPSRDKRQALAGESASRSGEPDSGPGGGDGAADDGGCLTTGENQSRRVYSSDGVFPTLSARSNSGQNQQSIYLCDTANTGSNGFGIKRDDVMNTLDTSASTAVAFAQNQRNEVRLLDVPGALAANPGMKQQSYVALDFHQQDARMRVSKQPDLSGTITAHADTGGNNVPMVMCRADTQANAPEEPDMAPTLSAHASHDAPYIYRKAQTLQIRSGKDGGGKGALVQDDLSATLGTHNLQTLFDMADGSMTVRRLTPTECERLQGFPDGWTDIPYKGKPHPSDTVRYKALGNSMAVPVMRRIGERIITFDEGSM